MDLHGGFLLEAIKSFYCFDKGVFMKITARINIVLCAAILSAIFCTLSGSAFADNYFKVTYEGTGTYVNDMNGYSSCISDHTQGEFSWKVIWPQVDVALNHNDVVILPTTNLSISNGTYDQSGTCKTSDNNVEDFACKGTMFNYVGESVDNPQIKVEMNVWPKPTLYINGPIYVGINGSCTGCQYVCFWYEDALYGELWPADTDFSFPDYYFRSAMEAVVVLSLEDLQTAKVIIQESGTTDLTTGVAGEVRFLDWSGKVTFEKISDSSTTTIDASSTTSSTTTTQPSNTTTIPPNSTTTTQPGSKTSIPQGSTTTTQPGNTTTTTTVPHVSTTTTAGGGGGCSPDHPVDCTSQGKPGECCDSDHPICTDCGCCAQDYPICGSDGYCHQGGSASTTTTVCAFAQSLDNVQHVDTLRKLRDSNITNRQVASLTAMYYQHAEEIYRIIENDQLLKKRFIQLVADNIAVARQLTVAHKAKIKAANMQRVISFLRDVKAHGSQKLQCDVDRVIKGLKDGSLLHGMGVIVE
jgi:hypothetical protein